MGAGHSRNLCEAAAANELDRARHFMKEDKSAVMQADKVQKASPLLRCPTCRRPADSLRPAHILQGILEQTCIVPAEPWLSTCVCARMSCMQPWKLHAMPWLTELCSLCRMAGRHCILQHMAEGEVLTIHHCKASKLCCLRARWPDEVLLSIELQTPEALSTKLLVIEL